MCSPYGLHRDYDLCNQQFKMNKETEIIKEYDLIVYPLHLVVAIGDVEKELNEKYRPAGADHLSFPDNSDGCTWQINNKETGKACLLLWIKELRECTASIVSHESGHVALDIFDYTESEISTENQEPFTYLLGAIARLVTDSLKEIPLMKKAYDAFFKVLNGVDKNKSQKTKGNDRKS